MLAVLAVLAVLDGLPPPGVCHSRFLDGNTGHSPPSRNGMIFLQEFVMSCFSYHIYHDIGVHEHVLVVLRDDGCLAGRLFVHGGVESSPFVRGVCGTFVRRAGGLIGWYGDGGRVIEDTGFADLPD